MKIEKEQLLEAGYFLRIYQGTKEVTFHTPEGLAILKGTYKEEEIGYDMFYLDNKLIMISTSGEVKQDNKVIYTLPAGLGKPKKIKSLISKYEHLYALSKVDNIKPSKGYKAKDSELYYNACKSTVYLIKKNFMTKRLVDVSKIDSIIEGHMLKKSIKAPLTKDLVYSIYKESLSKITIDTDEMYYLKKGSFILEIIELFIEGD